MTPAGWARSTSFSACLAFALAYSGCGIPGDHGSCLPGVSVGARFRIAVIEPVPPRPADNPCPADFDLAGGGELVAVVRELASGSDACSAGHIDVEPFGPWVWKRTDPPVKRGNVALRGSYDATSASCTGTVHVNVNIAGDTLERAWLGTSGACPVSCSSSFRVRLERMP